MKKIVALALCLVLALSLCATAFAAGFSADTHANALTKAAAGEEVTTIQQLTEGRAIVGANGSVTYYPATYLLTETKTVNGVISANKIYNAVEMATSAGASLVYVEGTTVRYFSTATNLTTITDKKLSAVKTVSDVTKVVCGDVLAKSSDDVFADANDNYYVANSDGTAYYVDGKVVKAVAANGGSMTVYAAGEAFDDTTHKGAPNAGYVYDIVHTFKAEKTVTKVNGVPSTTYTKLYCSECGKEFNFVNKSTEVAANLAGQTKFGVGNFKVVEVTDGDTSVWFAYEKTASAAAGTTTGVSSAKTFDAGIALYVGMSISAVAGSAVVIGKKKEF